MYDLNEIRANINQLNYDLSTLEGNPNPTPQLEQAITETRGRLIRQLILEDRHPQNPNRGAGIHWIQNELRLHRGQVQRRLRSNRPNVNHSLLEEVGLKMQQTAVGSARTTTAIQQRDAIGAVTGFGRTTVDVLSTTWSTIKIPLTFSLRVINVGAPYAGQLMGVMVQPLTALFHQLIFAPSRDAKTGRVDHPYNGQRVIQMGQNVGNGVARVADVTENIIRRFL